MDRELILSLKKHLRQRLILSGIKDLNVVDIVSESNRHIFLPNYYLPFVYSFTSIPFLDGLTVTNPWLVAKAIEAMNIKKTDTILEIGTGSGYQTSLLSVLANRVFTVEINEEASYIAKRNLQQLNINNIEFIVRNGNDGLRENMPYDAIILNAAVTKLAYELINQSVNGKVIYPLNYGNQQYLVKNSSGSSQIICSSNFINMVG